MSAPRRPRLAVARLETRATPANVGWTGGDTGAGTNWLDPFNWRDNLLVHRLPTLGDVAILNATVVGPQPVIVIAGGAVAGQLSNGREVQIDSGSLTLGPASHGLGTIRLSGGTLDIVSGSQASGQLDGPGTYTQPAGRTITFATFTANAPYVNLGTTVLAGATFTGPVTAPAGSLFRVRGLGGLNAGWTTAGFANDGTVELTSNTGATSAVVNVSSGTFVNAAGGTVAARAGTGGPRRAQLANGAAFENLGTFLVEPGVTLEVVTLGAFTWLGGTATGGGVLDLPTTTIGTGVTLSAPADATLRFDSDTINGPGTFAVPAGRTQRLAATTVNAPLTVAGTLLIAGGGANVTAALTTAAGTVLRVTGDTSPATLQAGGFTNNGLIELTSTSAFNGSVLAVANGTGALANAPGGVIATLPGLGGGRTINATGGGGLNNQGTLRVDASAVVNVPGGALTNTGLVSVAAGQTLSVGIGPFTNAVGGTLTGTGAVNSGTTFTNAGTVSPGASPGVLTVSAPYVQTATGSLAVELNGPSAGTEYDQLKVNGGVALAGALTINPASTPSVGTVFTIIDNDGTDAVSGTFAGLPQMGTVTVAGSTYRIAYNGGSGNDVTLTVLSTPGPAPRVSGLQVNSGQASATQRSRVTSIAVTFSAQVTFAGAVEAAFGLSRIGGGAVGGFTASASVVNGMTVVTLTGFTGGETNFGSLADGHFALVVRANQVTAGGLQLDGDGDGNGTGGDDYALNGTVANGLYRLFGDVNADGIVNAFDFGQFRGAFGTSTGQAAYLAFLDFNGDGTINAFDFGQFRSRFGSGVP